MLITTFFPAVQHAHSNEIFAAISQNLLNDLIDEVHTLHEHGHGQGGRTVQDALRETAARHGRGLALQCSPSSLCIAGVGSLHTSTSFK